MKEQFNTLIYANLIEGDKIRAAHYTALIQELAIDKGQLHTILDIGCGSGDFERLLREIGAEKIHLTGFDMASNLIAQARQKNKDKNTIFMNVKAADFKSKEHFDAAVSIMVLPYAEDIATLDSLFKAAADNLKEGGAFLSMTFNPAFIPTGNKNIPERTFGRVGRDGICTNFLSPENPEKVLHRAFSRQWSRKDYEASAKEAGFSDVRWTDIYLDESANLQPHQGHISFQPYTLMKAYK